MTAVHAELHSEPAARLARHCATVLINRTDRAIPIGFADGSEGIAWALTCLPGFSDAAQAALATSSVSEEPGFCRGAAGQVVARLGRPGSAIAGLEGAVRMLADRPVLGDLSLCHGELGVADALTVLASAHRLPVTVSARRRRAGLVLDAIDRYGPRCGTPRGVPTPGLLSGLAGIGYGLLRLGFAERVPSVLMLEPGIREEISMERE
jgi:lantibiotic modifying enzyme